MKKLSLAEFCNKIFKIKFTEKKLMESCFPVKLLEFWLRGK